MVSYFTTAFVAAFLPATFVLYLFVPARLRGPVLLAASYLFIFIMSRTTIAYLLAATAVAYGVALALNRMIEARKAEVKAAPREQRKALKAAYKTRMRLVLGAGLACIFGMLISLRYLGFFGQIASGALGLVGLNASFEAPRLGAAIGISFYSLMAASYLIDVYHEKEKADKNPLRVALFLSFFPQIMEGPISRYSQTAHSLWAGYEVEWDNIYRGLMRITLGFAKKLIIADRLNLLVKTVFDEQTSQDGSIIFIAAILYTIQLYNDFSGCMDVALGIGTLFGATMPENFRQPFFSQTASEFWQRWHITLGAWLKDYIYYPVTFSKLMKGLTSKARRRFGRRYGPLITSGIALFCVWFLNGLWHGAGSQYLLFGMYYFVVILLGGFLEPSAPELAKRFNIDREGRGFRVFRSLRTIVVVIFGELFFRAQSAAAGLAMAASVFTNLQPASLVNGTLLNLGMDLADFAIVAIFFAGVIALDASKERGHDPLEWASSQGELVRWGLWLALFISVVVFGAYGVGYVAVEPMYAQF